MKKHYGCLLVLVLFAVLISQSALSNTILPGEKEGLTGLDYLIKGAEREVELATAMTTGDFNGDGIMDIAVGATRASSPRGIVEAGAVSVFFGGSNFNTLPATFEAIADEKEDVLLYGSSAQEYVGEFLTSGDLNGDGIDDLIIAAQQIKDTGVPADAKEAKIYIVYGGDHFTGNMSLASKADVVIQRKDSMHAEDIVIADINADGTDDILMADILTDDVKYPPVAPRIAGEPRGINGAVYLIFGGGLTSVIDPSTDADSTIMRNAGEDVLQVYSLAAGDFNKDGKTDIALGAPGEDSATPELSEAGKVYLILDGQNLNGNVDIDTIADVVITGAFEGDQIGGKMAACDFNNDGFDDVIIGSPLSGWGEPGTTGKGRVQVVYGVASFKPAMDLFEDSNVTLQMSSDAARIGFKTGKEILGMDINGDAVDDLVIASPNAFAKAGTNGWVHVVFGSSSPSDSYELDKDADISIVAPESGSEDPLASGRMGQTMAAGDFNNDGRPDLVLGAPWGSGNNNYVGSGWFGIILDPVNSKPAVSCITVDSELNMIFPYLKLNEFTFSAIFRYAGSGLDFSLDASSLDKADTTQGMIEVNADLSIDVKCAEAFGAYYEFILVPDSNFAKWTLTNLNSSSSKN